MAIDKRILISGAGIAGLTLAYWLAKRGFGVELVEKRVDLADEGYMIDFYGSGFDVAERMGLIEHLSQKHVPVPRLEFVDRGGRVQASFNVERFRKLLGYRHFNFLRGDLAAVLYKHTHRAAPIRFGSVIKRMRGKSDGVEATFSDGAEGTYSLVIGADGARSDLRELEWVSGAVHERFLGFYVCCGIIKNFIGGGNAFLARQEPGRLAALYPVRDGKLAVFFVFASGQQGRLTRAEQQTMVEDAFAGVGWVVPRVLEAMRDVREFYYDAVSQRELDFWHKGRVAFVGDACQDLSLLSGQGASLAMAGAYVLAEELERSRGDHEAAFAAYEAAMKPEIMKRQLQARKFAAAFVPESRLALRVRNLFMKALFLPGFRSLFLRSIGAESIMR